MKDYDTAPELLAGNNTLDAKKATALDILYSFKMSLLAMVFLVIGFFYSETLLLLSLLLLFLGVIADTLISMTTVLYITACKPGVIVATEGQVQTIKSSKEQVH